MTVKRLSSPFYGLCARFGTRTRSTILAMGPEVWEAGHSTKHLQSIDQFPDTLCGRMSPFRKRLLAERPGDRP